MIYQGGAWPKEYWGKMFMGNIHGHRLNVDVLTPKGSGFVASRAPDFLLSHDSWAMFVNLQTGPDGNVYVIDWYDQQSCHSNNPQTTQLLSILRAWMLAGATLKVDRDRLAAPT